MEIGILVKMSIDHIVQGGKPLKGVERIQPLPIPKRLIRNNDEKAIVSAPSYEHPLLQLLGYMERLAGNIRRKDSSIPPQEVQAELYPPHLGY
ncbi:hypothetical protein COV20_05240 [Candidatus Woesearchaeota archaeon CG10_big_fil_rev_8_21_14_0_10_45_16]|nr:MAG: hypothetical protein COV20_05240 [Candidatus Woesearchaeota archaeon CG10_big_fil_rev_8_21_14_0_10_45_16]